MRISSRRITVVLVGILAAAAVTGCGGEGSSGPTLADVEAAAERAQQQPPEVSAPPQGYPPLPRVGPIDLIEDAEYHGPEPVQPPDQVQPGENPLMFTLHRITEVTATAADNGTDPDRARQILAPVQDMLDSVENDVQRIDADAWQAITQGVEDLYASIDVAAGGDIVKGAGDGETAAGDVLVAVERFVDAHMKDK